MTCEDEILIASVSTDNIIKIWSSITGENKFTIKNKNEKLNRLINIEGNNLMAITVQNDNKIQLWDLKEGKLFKIIENDQNRLLNLDLYNFTHDSKKIILSYFYNMIKFLNGDSGESIKELDNIENIDSLTKINKTELKDKLLIASGCFGKIRIWNFEDKKIMHTFEYEDHVCYILKNFIISDNNLLLSRC